MAELHAHPKQRTPVFFKGTQKLALRVSHEGAYIWNKVTHEWELFTWEELRAEAEKSKQS